ncbi:hypothetical protein [Streptomyces sp. NPDC006552]|uniref:nSTAND1 domain-containing NTPase n=1 Tax=Streptomyces sp. NPDC006552 TaxID=3157179 RepID=UPI0033A2513A
MLRLAAELRKLRHGAGSPSYRSLSALAHYSVATLSGAAAGRRLPTLDVTLAYVRACGGDAGEWERRWYQVAAELAAESDAAGAAAPEHRPPYAGLVAFEAEDCEWFFGRERLVADLARRVGQRRLVALFGASGAGKTSLLRAGLTPLLRAGGYRVIAFSPGRHPLEELAVRLAEPSGTPPGRLLREFTADPRGVHLTLRQLAAAGAPDAGRGSTAGTVLVVDQFEEIFTHCRDEQERTGFLAALLTVARAPKSGGRVVLGVRADFYPHCALHGELVEALRDGQVTVGPMNVDELHSVITRPAARAGCRVEGPLLAHLIAQAQGRAAVLPLLSHALLETWHRRRGHVLTLDGFRAAGGIEGALAQTAETFYAALPPDRQDVTRHLFQRLTTLGDGTEDTRRRITRAGLGTDSATADVLEHAARARLIVLDGDSVEITHEALLRGWPRLRHWLSEDRDLLRTARRLTEAADVWESLGRDPGALYRGARLAPARQLADARTHRLTASERAFLDASLAAERAEVRAARRRTGRLRLLTCLLALLLLLATGTTYYALRAGRQVTEQRNAAVALNASDRASTLEHKDPALARQVALAAHELAPQRRTRDNLLSTLMGTWRAHESEAVALAVVPGGMFVATGGGDRTARLWGLGGSVPRPVSTVRGMHGTVWSLAAAPGGHVLATADASGEIRTWSLADATAPAELAAFGPRDGAIRALAFSPDGRTLASGGADRTTRLWDVRDPARPRQLARLTGHVATVRSVAFDRSGRVVATVGDDRELQLWDVRDPRRPRKYGQWYAHAITALAVAFSPRADLLATAGGGDDSVRLWSTADPARPRRLAVLAGHSDVVGAVAFSPDGRTLATGSDDRTVRLWDVSRPAGPAPRTELTGYTTAVGAVAFAADGRTLFTGVYDGMVRSLPLDFPRVIGRACAAARPVLTEHQWHRYLPGVPFHPPCKRKG